jgi:hypothetical protein
MTTGLAVFAYGFFVDVLSTLAFSFTQRNRVFLAALSTTAGYGLALAGIVDVTKDPAAAWPYLSGIFVGGVVGVFIKQRIEK